METSALPIGVRNALSSRSRALSSLPPHAAAPRETAPAAAAAAMIRGVRRRMRDRGYRPRGRNFDTSCPLGEDVAPELTPAPPGAAARGRPAPGGARAAARRTVRSVLAAARRKRAISRAEHD